MKDARHAAPPAPALSPEATGVASGGAFRPARLRRFSRWRFPRWLLGGGAALLLALALWGIGNGPLYREWRLSRMSVEELERLRQGRLDDWRLLYHLGRRLNQQGRYVAADPLLRHAVGLNRDFAPLREEWAQALLGSGLVTAAFGQLKEFAGTHPRSAAAHRILGKFYVTQNSMERASEVLRRAVRLDPRDAEAWAYLSGAREALGDIEGARQAAERAVRLRPRNARYRLMFAAALDRANRRAEADREYAAAVRLAPSWPEGRRERGRWLLHGGGARAEGIAELREAVRLDPRDAEALLLLGTALLEEGDALAALDALRRAAALSPHDPNPARRLAEAYRRSNQPEAAAPWERRALALQRRAEQKRRLLDGLRVRPRDPNLHRRMARLYAEEGDVGGCVRHHAAAERCALDAPSALIPAAQDLVATGHAAEARPLAERAVRIAISNPMAHRVMGDVLLALGHLHLAAYEYNEAAGWKPEWTPALRARLAAAFARRAANPPPAERAYRRARQLEQSMVGPKRFTEEVEALARQAVELEPTNFDYLWYLLRIQMAQRENEEALATVNRLLALFPKDTRARLMRGVLRVEQAATPEEMKAVQADLVAGNEPELAATRHYALGVLALRRRDGENAVRHLRRAAALDPTADVTYYKLFLAERLNGNATAAQRALAVFRRRQSEKRAQAEALGDIARQPNRPELYERAARLFERQGLPLQAAAIRREARRRFGDG